MNLFDRDWYLFVGGALGVGRSCRSMVDRKITGLEVAGSSPVTITFFIILEFTYLQNEPITAHGLRFSSGLSRTNIH